MCLPVMIRTRELPAALRAVCSGTALPLRDRTNLSKRDQHFATLGACFQLCAADLPAPTTTQSRFSIVLICTRCTVIVSGSKNSKVAAVDVITRALSLHKN